MRSVKLSLISLLSVLALSGEVGAKSVIAHTALLNAPIDKEKILQKKVETLPSKLNVEITADTIKYNQLKDYYEAQGNAEAYLADRDAKLYADKISFDSKTQLLEAFGDIKVVQKDTEIFGTYISFNLANNNYELDSPKLFIEGLKLKARTVSSTYIDTSNEKNKKEKNVLKFEDGLVALDNPVSIYSHAANTRTRYSREIKRHNTKRKIDWNDLSDKSLLRYSAKEITIDNTRKTNNLSIKGARIWLNPNLSIPSPVHITTSVGDGADTQFKGPVIGNRERIGGFALGPRFYHEKDHGVYSFVPIVQLGNGPEFGGGAIATFNTPGDTTSLMAGYGSLDNRFIGSFHKDIYKKYFQVNALYNQFRRDSIFGTSQVGQLYELASSFRLKLPFIDERGMKFRLSAGWAADNLELFSADRIEDLAFEQDGRGRKEHEGFRADIETALYTKPVWRYGHEFRNLSLSFRGQGGFRFYDTGDFQTIGSFGPALEARIDNIAFEIDYLFSVIGGESPFLFDQYVTGNQAIILDGDYIVNRWFSVGTSLTYNIERERFVRNEVRTELGPQDFKVRLSYDTIRNQIDLGFNVLFGDPVEFDKLKVKI